MMPDRVSLDQADALQHPLERLRVTARRQRRMVLIGVDVTLLGLAYVVTAALRYESGPVPWIPVAVVASIAVVVHVGLCWAIKTYRGRVLIGSSEETQLLGAVAVASVALVSLVNIVVLDHLIARTIPLAAGFLAVAFMVIIRAVWRGSVAVHGWRPSADSHRTLVVGAGDAGRQLVWSMLGSANSPYFPVAMLDDDPWKAHLRHYGVPVKGTLDTLAEVVRAQEIDTVVMAIPSATGLLIKTVSDQCAGLDVEVKVLPPVDEIFGPRVTIRDVRDIDVTDVLGRHAIQTDVSSIADYLSGKRVLVTGAGGSIGAELSRQIAQWEPAELMLLDRDESALHGVQLTIHGHGLLDTDETILADIRDEEALHRIFTECRPEVVFHAAALKHLPLLERYPVEGIKTNVIGTLNVLRAASAAGVERFVNVSTDKAADPVNVLGMSKRVAERLTASFARDAAGEYLSVRFGNVLGSRGSVLTAWAAQIATGGPLTVTHPDVTRYFMTIPEACQLVIQAGAIGSGGETLILDMGEPVRLDDVARKLIEQSGQNIKIRYTGLREGEKMHEVLRSESEADHRPHHELITHVAVAPLAAAAVAEEFADNDAARRGLRIWCGGEYEPQSSRLPVRLA